MLLRRLFALAAAAGVCAGFQGTPVRGLRLHGARARSLTPTSSSSPGNAYTYVASHGPVLYRVAAVCLLNIVLNILRPFSSDEGDWLSGTITTRLYRAMWDGVIAAMAYLGAKGDHPPAVFKILAGMLLLTGLVDVLFWSPLYAFNTSMQKCDCVKWGWGLLWPPCLKKECRFDFVTGPVRLFVAAQTFAVGLFCGMSSVAVDGIWKHLRDETKEARMARAIGHRNSL